MSQFWYSDETATRLAEEVIREAGEGGRYDDYPTLDIKIRFQCST